MIDVNKVKKTVINIQEIELGKVAREVDNLYRRAIVKAEKRICETYPEARVVGEHQPGNFGSWNVKFRLEFKNKN